MENDKARDRTANEGFSDAGATPMKAKKSGRRRWILIVFGVVVVVPAALLAAWTAIALHWAYSEGNRAGYIQKFSHKGWVCKTWEGELQTSNIPGSAPQLFTFSVRDDNVAKQITQLMGSRVSMTYQEHKGVPGSCFAETNYFVTGVKVVP
ncbi:MAG: hypothetical protein ABJE10_12320 [bacterium]